MSDADLRRLRWPRLANVRDLGGLPTAHGRPTARGVLVRSDTLDRLTPQGLSLMRAYGVRTVIDLRPHGEAAGPVQGVTWRCVPLVPPDFPFPIPLTGGYARIIDEHAPALAQVLRAIAGAEPGGVLFHCHSGTGRTGLVALLLLAIASVARAAIQEDYLLSHPPSGATAEARAVVPSTLAHLDERCGGPAGCLAHAGVTGEEVRSLRDRLLGT